MTGANDITWADLATKYVKPERLKKIALAESKQKQVRVRREIEAKREQLALKRQYQL